ncbi:MobF family relaxase [Roseicella aquatilis]|uniref:Toprim domain-containing protein n=1 Tax=Roseicella aquatilis TaxID=2527868 RepID=A0A4R4DIX4_9PROT|nr:MobF family relaxase [Roseicella aquatilis]TCZ61141.1 hypothetical protein EXY23_13510 [Roseicella aquatilis]
MLTWRTMAAGAPSEAAAYAAHLLERTLDDAQMRLAAYYGRYEAATGQAIDLGMGSVPLPRADTDPALAAALGLDPTRLVREGEFANLLGGRRADGAELAVAHANVRVYGAGAGGGEGRVKVSGMDLCFSAPKSVSLAWMAAADDAERAAILQAHRQANAEALRYVEQQIGIARLGDGGAGGTERGRITWISVDHYTARPTVEVVRPDPVTGVMGTEIHTVRAGGQVRGDPQLHTHNVVPNVMVTESGRTVAINRDLLRGRIHEFGAVYQAVLATRLRDIGIHVDLDERTQTARIPCIPQHACDAFSKRTRDGEAAARAEAARRGLDWDAMAPDTKVAFLKGGALASRRFRTDDLADAAAWRATMAAIGWKHGSAIGQGPKAAARTEEARLSAAHAAACRSLDPELGRRAVLSGYDVRTAAARGLIAEGLRDTGEVSVVAGMMAARGVRQDGRMTRLLWREDGDGRARVTTELHRDQEAEVVRLARAGAADHSAALTLEAMRAAVRRSGVRFQGQTGVEQVEAVKRVGAAGRVSVFVGAAGVGKTTRVLPPLVEAWKADGRDVWGVGLAWRQASALAEAGIERDRTVALQPFLARLAAGEIALTSRSVVVVDELSQVGTRQLLGLLRHRAERNFILVMTGDPRQCQSVEAGPVVELLREALGEAQVPQILTVVRQASEREREIASLFRGRDGETEEERLAAVRQALAMKRSDRTAELVEGGYRDAVSRVAALYMERAAANREAGGTVTVSAPSNAEALDISRAIRALRRAAGEVGQDATHRAATDGAGNAYTMAIAPGDRVRLFQRTRGTFTERSGRARSAVIGNNGSVLTVRGVTKAGLRLETANGKVGLVTWDAFRPRGAEAGARLRLAYGDCLTIDAAQGITSDEHISALPGGSATVQGLKGYVAASRHRTTSWLVVSKGMELREVEDHRPLNAPAPEGREAVERALWENVARNLARQPVKESALAMLREVQHGAERAANALREGARRMQARARTGARPATLGARFRARHRREALARLGDRLEEAMRTRAPLLQRLAAHAAAARAARERQEEAPAARPARPAPARRLRRIEVSEADAAAQLMEAMRAHGLAPKTQPVFDGAFHYVPRGDDRGRQQRGGYRARPHATLGFVASIFDMKEGGWIGSWRAQGEAVRIGPDEAARRRADEARRAVERERAWVLREAGAAARAERIVAAAGPAPLAHPYLVAKGLAEVPEGVLVTRRGALLVPLRDAEGRLRSLQTIGPDGAKLYLKGAQKTGVFHLLGTPLDGRPIGIAEGLATAASVRAATRHPVVVALDTSNLLPVAVAVRDRCPASPILFAADNDHHLPRRSVPLPNAGWERAERAAAEVGGLVVLAPELPERAAAGRGTDWNDVHALRGVEAVREAFRTALRAAETPAVQATVRSRTDARQDPGMRP